VPDLLGPFRPRPPAAARHAITPTLRDAGTRVAVVREFAAWLKNRENRYET